MSEEIMQATALSSGGLKVKCLSRNFSFYLDEPEALGGTDTGMNPAEALLSALGACQCIVARSFAKKYRISLTDIQVRMEGILDTDGFTGKNKHAKMGFSKIVSKFYIRADNSDDEIRRFVGFIERTCPVLDTFINTPDFVTEIHSL